MHLQTFKLKSVRALICELTVSAFLSTIVFANGGQTFFKGITILCGHLKKRKKLISYVDNARLQAGITDCSKCKNDSISFEDKILNIIQVGDLLLGARFH